MKYEWVEVQAVYALHQRQISEHGGSGGVRDEGFLLAALAPPENLHAYGEDVEPSALAASYAYGIAKNHPFLDCNKRTALVTAVTFLNLNGSDFDAPPAETYLQFLGLAEGSVSEEELSIWFRERLFAIVRANDLGD